ncbi:MAG: CHRD domain-containing protein [Trueperaceae bacterium]
MKRSVLLTFLAALAGVLAACVPALQPGFNADLTTAAEVPPPTLDGATPSGSSTAMLTGNTLTVTGNFAGLTGPATAAHIHGPAPVGEAAGVVFPLQVDNAVSGNLSGTWADMTEEQLQQLRDGLFYVNVHTAMNGAGEIRGQLR